MQPKKLEHYKFFAPIAWTLCIGFAAFVFLLVMKVNATVSELHKKNFTFEQSTQILSNESELKL